MLDGIERKIEAGERLGLEEGVALFEHPDLLQIGRLANRAREARHGDKAYYVVNRHINYSNVCKITCLFCAFARRPGQEGGYTYTLDEILERADEAAAGGADELHIVGGLHPDLPFEFYKEMLRGLRERQPRLHRKTFTAVEIDFLADLAGLSVEQTLEELREAGLQSMTGGGAEIFAPRVHGKVCGQKIGADRYLEIHGIAHRMGIRSTTTMLYGHIETAEERVDHMLRLREQQDRSGGFTAFIPLAFHPANTFMEEVPGPSGMLDLRCIAVARLLLDNIDHIKTYWIMSGLKIAQLALSFGADDIDGTVVEEKITHMAGGTSPEEVPEEELRRLIVEAGRVPVRRDTLYNEIVPPAPEPEPAGSARP